MSEPTMFVRDYFRAEHFSFTRCNQAGAAFSVRYGRDVARLACSYLEAG